MAVATFPNTFAERMRPLPTGLGDSGNEAAAKLAERGFIVEAGLTPYLAGAIGQIATQRHIREFCPKDETASRFQSEESVRRWVAKNGGRAMFGLAKILEDGSRRWIGYGWTGPEENEKLPDSHVTFAVRLGGEATGKGLAVPFTKLIVLGSAALYGARDMSLETWESNTAGGKYVEAGFVYADAQTPDVRPTLEAVGAEINGWAVWEGEDGRHMVEDVRRYMTYPNELLPAA